MPTTLTALQHRPAAIEPPCGEVALPAAHVEAAGIAPLHAGSKIAVDLENELPAVRPLEVPGALPFRECAVGLPLLLKIRPFIGGTIPTAHELIPAFLHRVVGVVVFREL